MKIRSREHDWQHNQSLVSATTVAVREWYVMVQRAWYVFVAVRSDPGLRQLINDDIATNGYCNDVGRIWTIKELR